MEWEVGGGVKKEGTWVHLWLIHIDVWQKPTQHCKAIILQLKINTLKKIKLSKISTCLGPYVQTFKLRTFKGVSMRLHVQYISSRVCKITAL